MFELGETLRVKSHKNEYIGVHLKKTFARLIWRLINRFEITNCSNLRKLDPGPIGLTNEACACKGNTPPSVLCTTNDCYPCTVGILFNKLVGKIAF